VNLACLPDHAEGDASGADRLTVLDRGWVMPSGNLAHFKDNRDGRRVPRINADSDKSEALRCAPGSYE
jgi:hypothetical protein